MPLICVKQPNTGIRLEMTIDYDDQSQFRNEDFYFIIVPELNRQLRCSLP